MYWIILDWWYHLLDLSTRKSLFIVNFGPNTFYINTTGSILIFGISIYKYLIVVVPESPYYKAHDLHTNLTELVEIFHNGPQDSLHGCPIRCIVMGWYDGEQEPRSKGVPSSRAQAARTRIPIPPQKKENTQTKKPIGLTLVPSCAHKTRW